MAIINIEIQETEIEVLLLRLENIMEEYNQAAVEKSKLKLLKEASEVSTLINQYFQNQNHTLGFLNAIKTYAVNIFDRQIAFLGKS